VPVFDPPGPLDLRRTLSAVGVDDWSDGKAWWAVETGSGPATVALSGRDGRIEAEGWGSGADEAVARVPRLLGFDDDPAQFAPGPLRELHLRSLGLRLGATGAVFDAVVPAVLGQLVTRAEAVISRRKLHAVLGTPAPGPRDDLLLPPAAEVIGSMEYQDLHPFGIEAKRARTLIEAARRSRRLEEIVTMGRDDAYRRLTAVRGIGPWTAAMVMGEAWGDRDAVPIGDHNLPSTVTWALRGQRKGTDDDMLELLEPFRPNRRRAIVLLKQSGIKAPRRGPKMAVRRHL
jgi:3-methyladenine DNA glycosylase/8-oxoguanine DNA glycosylase